MQEPLFIRKVAVLGAGVMGAQIAAHCTNAGIETFLFDLPSEGKDKYAFVNQSIKNLTKLKPSPLGIKENASLLHACQYDDDIELLNTCDIVIEAIAERLDWKEALFERIAPHLNEHAILASNTSGLSIHALAGVLPESLQHRFCGIHFFNPPRYMHLAEIIPAPKTEARLLDALETWLTSYLGKGVVRAKDTPNFIANRIGVFSLLATLHHAKRLNIGFDVVDALTGTLLGRPKSATCRTMDVVGLDTMAHVVRTMTEGLKNDPWHAYFVMPEWLTAMIEQGFLGQKSGQGIYRKNGRAIEVYDLALQEYRAVQTPDLTEIKAILKAEDKTKQLEALEALGTPEALLIASCFRDLFHYTAYHLEHIADTVYEVDAALKWGFGWQQGPFESWQAFGVENISAWINASIGDKLTMSSVSLPGWLNTPAFKFYEQSRAFNPKARQHVDCTELPVYQKQHILPKAPEKIFENEGVVLSHLKDDIAVLSFKSKANTIGQPVLDGISEAIVRAQATCQGLIVYQHNATNFSSGADLAAIAQLIAAQKMHAVSDMVKQFQHVLMQLKYSAIPVVTALRGRALGGGCELMMQTDATVAAYESYPGLVEAGVGLIPAGGGSKEFALRAALKAEQFDVMLYLKNYFEQIAMGVVAGSAAEAKQRHFLRADDTWIMHTEEVLYAAVAKVQALNASNYKAPIPATFKVAGRDGEAQLKALLVNYHAGGFISDHDLFLSNLLAHVLCGGDVDAGTYVDEAWILRLEHDAFMQLAETKATQARIQHILNTGKPLRN